MTIKLMSPRGLGSIVKADFLNETVEVENFTDEILDRAFGINENPTWKDFEIFLEDRCFPETRHYMKLQLQSMGLPCYDHLLIIRKTQGRVEEDDLWLEIED